MMMIGKLLIALLLCFSTLSTVCKGSPSSLEDRKDFLSISASSPSDSNDVDSMMLQSIPQKTVTSVQYRTEVRTLRNVPQINYTPPEFPYETKIHSIPDENAAEETVKERPTADHTARNRNNVRHTRHDKPRVTGHERPSQYGISKVSQHKMAAVHSIMRTSSRPRLKAAADQENGDKNGKSKRKDKKKRADSRAKEDSVDLVMSQSVVTGILAGSLVLLFCVTGFVWLWRKRKCRRRIDSELTSVVIVSRTADLDEGLSDGEIIFEEKIVVFKNNDVNSVDS